MSELEHHISRSLRRDAEELAGRWRARAIAAGGGVPGVGGGDDGDKSEIPGGVPLPAEAGSALIHGLSDATVGHAHGIVSLARAGWHFGASRHRDGADLFQVLWEIELLEAVVLHAAERCAEQGGAGANASDGLRVARTIQRAAALLARAAAKGHTHAWVAAQRRHFSALRHDIRNPLGTIRNAIAFLEDDSIPEQMRDLRRFRRMIVRNAAQADALITQHLGDVAVLEQAHGPQPVSIHRVALSVRRGLRGEAKEAGVEIHVAEDLPVVRVDAAAVELALLATVAGAIDTGARRVSIQSGDTRERSVRIHVSAEAGTTHEAEGLSLARELARWAGGELSVADDIVLELPVSPGKAGGDLARASES